MSLSLFETCRQIVRVIGIIVHPFYLLAALFSTRKSVPTVTNPILIASASELAKKIRTRELTCQEVVSTFIERCKLVNPIVNAVIKDRFEEAIEEARKADTFLRCNRQLSIWQLEKEKPLLGIPITIKECCSLKGMTLSVGVKQYEKRIASYNGDAVQKLINAGAIPIAVTSTPPYSLGIETFNDIIGYTSNPYDTRKSVGGSSGGEAALIASAASALGLASDSGGSIRIPAAFCGIYGHKSTKGLVSSKGHVTFLSNADAENMLTVGPICRYAVDLELALNVLSANKLQNNDSRLPIHLKHINIFHVFEYRQREFSVDKAIKKAIQRTISHFSSEYGCQVKQLREVLPEFQHMSEITFYHSLQFITSLTEDSDNKILKKFIKIVRNTSLYKRLKSNEKLFLKKKEDLQNKLLKLLEANGILLLPTWPESAFYRYESIWKIFNTCYTYFVNAMGLTSTAVPIGLDRESMPLSIQVIAAPTQDYLCVLVATELEKLFGGWTLIRNSKSNHT